MNGRGGRDDTRQRHHCHHAQQCSRHAARDFCVLYKDHDPDLTFEKQAWMDATVSEF